MSFKDSQEYLLAHLLKDRVGQRKFVVFLKSSFNEALQLKLSTGNKSQYKMIKQLIKDVFVSCLQQASDENMTNFLKEFLYYDLVVVGGETASIFAEKSVKGIREHFKDE